MSADPSQQDAEADTFEIGLFGEASQFRDFKVVVEGRSFFVNGSFLAERSPFFAKLCFGDFLEANLKEAELKDVTIEEFHALLMVIGAHPTADRTKVTARNCARLLKLADKWDVKLVRELCEKYIEKDLHFESTTFELTTELLLTCDSMKLSSDLLSRVVCKLADFENHNDRILTDGSFEKMSQRTVAALFTAVNYNQGSGIPNRKHSIRSRSYSATCQIVGCEVQGFRCDPCKLYFCKNHETTTCLYTGAPDFTLSAVTVIKMLKYAPINNSDLYQKFFSCE